MKIPKLNSLAIGIFIFLISCFIFYKSCNYILPSPIQPIQKTDTVIKLKAPEIKLIKQKDVETPAKVILYKERKPEERKKIEKEDLITSIILNRRLFRPNDQIQVTRIDTSGVLYTNIYSTKKYKEINIDHKGQVQIKRKKKIAQKIIIIAGTAILVSLSGKYAYSQWQKRH